MNQTKLPLMLITVVLAILAWLAPAPAQATEQAGTPVSRSLVSQTSVPTSPQRPGPDLPDPEQKPTDEFMCSIIVGTEGSDMHGVCRLIRP